MNAQAAIHILFVIVVLVLSGCGREPGRQNAPGTETGAQPPRFVVFGVDRTESFEDMTRNALKTAAITLLEARPGDELIFRWISDRSYASDEIFAHVQLQGINDASSPYDMQGKRERRAVAMHNRQLKQYWLKQIQGVKTGGTPRTDIFGFIAAAADHFESAPQNMEKHLILATDLADNMQYSALSNLQGVKVTIYPIKTGLNPINMQAIKKSWARYFSECGAVSSQFLRPKTVTAHAG